eukprot:m.211551 g.211551  ORF g.211551 m.211551 type:complete len:238 (-) comp15839_c0_seq1:454-1167(-)
MDSLDEKLRLADVKFRGGNHKDSIELFDESLEICRELQDKAKEVEVLLGKGIALLGMAGENESIKESGLTCLIDAKSLASSSGNQAQIMFIDMLIDNKGQFPGAQTQCSSTPEQEHVQLAQAVASTAKSEPVTLDNTETSWDATLDEHLVLLVAELGLSWDIVTERLKQKLQEHSSLVQSIQTETVMKRWHQLAPIIKDELKDADQKRDCGHSCRECPTRSDCKLHEAVDMEDLFHS